MQRKPSLRKENSKYLKLFFKILNTFGGREGELQLVNQILLFNSLKFSRQSTWGISYRIFYSANAMMVFGFLCHVAIINKFISFMRIKVWNKTKSYVKFSKGIYETMIIHFYNV